jgi:REP-associated tyrosine transposase
MNNTNSLSHTRWECKYHVVWIPKCRRKTLYGQLRKNLGEVLHELARQKESKVLEGHLQSDPVHMLVSISPKYAVSQVIGYIKGKSAIYIARNYLGQRNNYGGMSFWVRGYLVSTVGTDEEVIRAYIRDQEKEDHRVEQLKLL